MEYNKRCIATGAPGTGKTACVRNLSAKTKRPYIRINGMAGLDPSDQIGNLQAKDGSTFYSFGDAAVAAKYGAVLAYDEPFKNSASVNMCYQNLAEEDNPKLLLYGHPEFAERHLIPDPRFRFFLCDNVKGTGDDLDKYAATEVQDSSFLNRMSIILAFDYLPYQDEVNMMQRKFTDLSDDEAGMMVKMAQEVRKAWETDQVDHPYSPRNLLEWGKAYFFCGNIAEAFKRTYSYYGEKDDIQGALQDFWRDCDFPIALI